MSVPVSVLELATVSQGSTPADSLKNSLKLAREVEKLGYNRFWLAEHHNMISIASTATPVLIGYIAGGTEKIRVGSGGIMLPNHSPLIVAEQFGTLGSLYPNRIDLGLGRAPGTDQLTAQAIRPDRMQATHNFPNDIEQIQRYFSKENSSAKVRATIAEGVDVPIWILGSSTDSAHLAAAKGLPYAFASHFAPGQLMEALSIYHNNFEPSQYLDKPYTMAAANVIVADTTEEAESLSTSLIKMFLGILTNQRDYMQPPAPMTSDLRELLLNPAFQRMMKYSFIGDKEKVESQTKDFLKNTQVDELMVVSNMYSVNDRIKSYRMFSEAMASLSRRT